MTSESETLAPESIVHPSAALASGGRKSPDSSIRQENQGAYAPRSPDVIARVADFAELTAPATPSAPTPLDRLLDVTVGVTAELGRVTLPISAVLNLNVNSVLELNRSVSEPVDLMVQGVLLARGEVVVVNDCFAVRIKEIAEPKKRE